MSLQQRRLLFYTFIFLFILIAPFVILSATGQTINWKKLSIQKTGSLVIESNPSNADIFLNNRPPTAFLEQFFGKPVPPKTAATLSKLTPGTYTVRLELPGHFPWEEKITIRPNEVVNIGPVYLFKQRKPQLISRLPLVDTFLSSPNKEILLIPEKNQIRFINLPTKIDITIPVSTIAPLNARWSSTNQMVIVNEEFILDKNGQNILQIKDLAPYNPTFLRWDNNQSNILFFENKEILYSLNIATKKITEELNLQPLLVGRQLVDYQPNGRHIYLVFTKNQATELITLSSDVPAKQNLAELPQGRYRFMPLLDNRILLEESTNHSLYQIDQPLPLFLTPRITAIAQPYTVGRWADETLIYATPLEIRQWNNGKERLIGRLSEPIIDVTLISDRQSILVITPTSIIVWPLASQPFTKTITLLTSAHIDELLAITNTTIQFRGRIDEENGIFSLEY